MGRILTLLRLKKRAFAALNGRQEVSVSDDEAAGVAASLAKADNACLTAGDVLGCSFDGASVSLDADGYAAGRLVPEASVTVTKDAAATVYAITPAFADYKCKMDKGDGRYDVRFQMTFTLSPSAELSGVHYVVKRLMLYKTDNNGSGLTYVEFTAFLVLGFDGAHNTASSASLWGVGSGASVPVADVGASVSSRVVTLTYAVTDKAGVALLDEFYTYVQNGRYRLSMTCASGDSRVSAGDVTVTT